MAGRLQHMEGTALRLSRVPQLIADVTERVFDRLPDETWFYPGHGSDSTLGTERPHLRDWRQHGW